MRKNVFRFVMIVLLTICLSVSQQGIVAKAQSDPTPTVSVKIYRIQAVDTIEGFLEDGADWRYKISVWDGDKYVNSEYKLPGNDDDVVVNRVHSFDDILTVSSPINIYLYEDDTFGHEVADISSGAGRTTFQCTYDLKTNTFTGDEVITEGGYFKTSGDYDTSIATDQNDANLWFTIWDNYEPPTADAGSDQSCYSGDKVNFDGSGSMASSGSSIEQYEWDFENDGIVDAEGQKTSYTYPAKGQSMAVLRITDNLGEWDEDACMINVLNRHPTADFACSPSNPTIQDTVDFVDTSTDQDGAIASWFWSFGDGTDSTGQNPSHQYADKGNYSVQLTVRDNDNAPASKTTLITVHNLSPAADFTFSPANPKVGSTVEFNDASGDPEGKQITWLWDFGDGYTSTTENPSHQYAEVKQFVVNLTVTDDEGAVNFITKTINVGAIPFYEEQWFYPVVAVIIIVIGAAAVLALYKRKSRITPKG